LKLHVLVYTLEQPERPAIILVTATNAGFQKEQSHGFRLLWD
jgi:hypothetical protein